MRRWSGPWCEMLYMAAKMESSDAWCELCGSNHASCILFSSIVLMCHDIHLIEVDLGNIGVWCRIYVFRGYQYDDCNGFGVLCPGFGYIGGGIWDGGDGAVVDSVIGITESLWQTRWKIPFTVQTIPSPIPLILYGSIISQYVYKQSRLSVTERFAPPLICRQKLWR